MKFRDGADIGAIAEALFQNRQRFETVNAKSRLDALNTKYRAKKFSRAFNGLRGLRAPAGGFISPRQAKTLGREIRAEFYRRAAQLRKRFPRRSEKTASVIKIPDLSTIYKIEFEDRSVNIESVCEQYRKDPDIARDYSG
ncbi:MAG: hypothetical protein KKH34_07835 [Candidatus Omnitrophica bacterium]|nr:hypothetical protein [Candidatus Omnitrophota bacterium]